MEKLRFAEVSRFVNLNIEADMELQELVEMASVICQKPIAIISALDADTQYVKIKKGIVEKSFPRETTFCDHTIQQAGLFVVPDTKNDARFAANTLVNSAQPIRFYAGLALITSKGVKIGTLCVMDYYAGSLNHEQKKMLEMLAHQAVKILELMEKTTELEKNEKEVREQQVFIKDATIRLRSFFESSTNFQVLLGKGGEVIDFNKTAYTFVKHVHKAELKRGDMFITYIAPSFVSTFIDRYNMALTGQSSVEEGSTEYKEKGIIWWDASFEPARNNENEIIGVSYIIRDVSERKFKEQKILDQNQSLLKIAHIQAHEFRAPLTTIMGLMSLIKQEKDIKEIPYLLFLEQAVTNLDEKIKGIVLSIEDGVIR